MNIEAGKKYRTRDGRVALVGAVNGDAYTTSRVIGWLDGNAFCWRLDGTAGSNGIEADIDLIAEHREPREWFIWVHPDGAVLHSHSNSVYDAPATRVRVREIVGDDK